MRWIEPITCETIRCETPTTRGGDRGSRAPHGRGRGPHSVRESERHTASSGQGGLYPSNYLALRDRRSRERAGERTRQAAHGVGMGGTADTPTGSERRGPRQAYRSVPMAGPLSLVLTLLLTLVAAVPAVAQDGTEHFSSGDAERLSSELGQGQPRLEGPSKAGQGPVQEQEVEEETRTDGQSASYLPVLCVACVLLAALTSRWWAVPVLGAAEPLVLAILDRFVPGLGSPDDGKARERELLEALAKPGEGTPAAVAMRTSLTVEEASKMLDELSGEGHLKLRTEDGIVAYSLPGHGWPPALDGGPEPVGARPEAGAAPERLDDPLSEREVEVLALVASGRTNAEISGDLFVAVGTVKSHLNSIYRKLGAANRAEAVAKARRLDLLH